VLIRFPEASVWTNCVSDGAVHPTPTGLPMGAPRAAVGSFGASLHSNTLPIELFVNPDPVMVTVAPLVRPLLGVTVIVPVTPAANADTWLPTIVSPATKKVVAPMARNRETPRR
jgi:hypothetical protein